MDKEIEGLWGENDPRRIFVEGAKWWEFHKTGFTMWQTDIRIAEDEAERRFPGGEPRSNSRLKEASLFAFGSMQKVYHMLNMIASGETMEDWQRYDWPAVVAQVYGDLAPAFLKLMDALNAENAEPKRNP